MSQRRNRKSNRQSQADAAATMARAARHQRHADAAKQAQHASINQNIIDLGAVIYAQLAARDINPMMGCDTGHLRACAKAAYDAAPYYAEACGLVTIGPRTIPVVEKALTEEVQAEASADVESQDGTSEVPQNCQNGGSSCGVEG